MYERKTAVLLLAIIVVIASIMTCAFALFMAMNLGDTDKYDVSRDYIVTGTVTADDVPYDCTGTGQSKYVRETGNEHIYTFTFDLTYADSSKRTVIFDLFCNSSGIPLSSMYDKVSEIEGSSVWRCTDDSGITFLFTIEKYCKVTSMNITGDGLSLNAALKE